MTDFKDKLEQLKADIATEKQRQSDAIKKFMVATSQSDISSTLIGLPVAEINEDALLAKLKSVASTGTFSVADRIAALEKLKSCVANNEDMLMWILGLTENTKEPIQVRAYCLELLQRISFDSKALNARQSEYAMTLKKLVNDSDKNLSAAALTTLAWRKDSEAQNTLIEGLKDPTKQKLVPAKAIQLLAQDIRGQHLPVIKDVLAAQLDKARTSHDTMEISASTADDENESVIIEALHALAPDAGSAELITNIATDKSLSANIRQSAINKLHHVNLAAVTKTILSYTNEDSSLVSASINAILHSKHKDYFVADQDLNNKISELSATNKEPEVLSAASKYMLQVK